MDGHGWGPRARQTVLGAAALLLALSLVALLTGDSEPEFQVLQTPAASSTTSTTEAAVLPETTAATATTLPPPPPTPTTSIPPRRMEPIPDDDVVASISDDDLWLQGRTSGRTVQVTSDGGEQRREHSPAFRDGRRLTFVSASRTGGNSTLEELDLRAGTHRIVTELQGYVLDADWSPDGSALAYISAAADYHHHVRILEPGTGKDVTRRDLGAVWGRGLSPNYDQVKVDWSADGTKLLVVDTHVNAPGSQPPLHVLRPDGTDVVPPREGTWADWSPDSRTVYFVPDPNEHAAAALDIQTAATTVLPTTGPVRRLAVSPDGRSLAYDDGAAEPAVSVYELAARTARRLRTQALGPVWRSPDTLLASRATRCVVIANDDCEAGGHRPRWTEEGRAWEIRLDGDTQELPVPRSTLDMAMLN